MPAAKHMQTAQPLPTREQAKAYIDSMIAAGKVTEISADISTLTQEDLFEWYQLKEQLDDMKAKEMTLRLKIFKHYFPSPEEGTQNVRLPDGFVVKATYPIVRKIDPAHLDAFRKLTVKDVYDQLIAMKMINDQTTVDFNTPLTTFLNLNVDNLVKYDPDLIIKEYRTLTDEQRQFFEQCMEIKPGSPAIKIVPPSAKSQAAAE